jgi:hypothetical protein
MTGEMSRGDRRIELKESAQLWVVTVITTMLALGLVAPAGSSATDPSDWGPGFKGCGSFHVEYRIQVFAKHVSCAKARRIQKEYWLAPKSRTEEIIPEDGPPVVRLKRFPGWICGSGSGGGSCTKGDKVAAYSDL